MIQEKDFLYRVPVKTAPITTPRGQIRNPEILVDLEGGEFMHGNILDANSTNKLINQSVKDAVDNKLIESEYVTKDLLDAETTRATEQENSLKTLIGAETSARTKGDEALSTKVQAEQTRAEGKEKEISDKLAIVDGDSNTEGSFRKAIADVIAAAPEDLDTLKEIADKLAGNDDLHTALNQAITEKADASALANEVTRATGAESGLQAAIATKADAAALSNYVLTAALNQQVDTLNTAISAKQDAGNYIPYDSTDAVYYKIDRALKITENGLTGIISPININLGEDGVGPGTFKVNPEGITQTTPSFDFSLNNEGLSETIGDGSKFKISPSQILLQKDDNNLVKISSDGMQLKKDGSDFIDIDQSRLMYTTNRDNVFIGQTSKGFQLNLTDNGNACYAVISGYQIYVKDGVALTNNGIVINPGSSSPTYIYNKANKTLGAPNIIGGKVSDSYGDLRDGINKVQQKVTANTTAIGGKQDKGNYIEYSSKDNDGYTIDCEFNTSEPITVDGGIGYLTYVTQSGIETHDSSGRQSNLTVTSLSIASSPTTRTTYTINGITTTQYKNCLATSDGTFKPISDFVLKEDANEEYVRPEDFENLNQAFSGLSRKVSSKQDTITANIVDITNLETADITQLRTIVKDLLNALSRSGLIIESQGVE